MLHKEICIKKIENVPVITKDLIDRCVGISTNYVNYFADKDGHVNFPSENATQEELR